MRPFALLLPILVLPSLLGLWTPAAAGHGAPQMPKIQGAKVLSAELSTDRVDVSDGPQPVTVTLRIADSSAWWRTSGTGYLARFAIFTMPTRTGAVPLERISGTKEDGVYRATLVIPAGSLDRAVQYLSLWQTPDMDAEAAKHRYDNVGLARGVFANMSLSVRNTNPDLDAPEVSELTLSARQVDSTCPRTLTVSARVTDPDGVESGTFSLFGAKRGTYTAKRVSGTAVDGVWQQTMTLHSKRSESGAFINLSGVYTPSAVFQDVLGTESEVKHFSDQTVTVTRNGLMCSTPGWNAPHPPTRVGSPAVTTAYGWSTLVKPGISHTLQFGGHQDDPMIISMRTAPSTTYRKVATLVNRDGKPSINWAMPGRPTRNTYVMATTGNGAGKPLELKVESTATFAGGLVKGKARSVRFTGTVVPALNGRLVRLFRNDQPVASARTNASGAYVLTAKVPPGVGYFEAVTKDDVYNAGTISREIELNVR